MRSTKYLFSTFILAYLLNFSFTVAKSVKTKIATRESAVVRRTTINAKKKRAKNKKKVEAEAKIKQNAEAPLLNTKRKREIYALSCTILASPYFSRSQPLVLLSFLLLLFDRVLSLQPCYSTRRALDEVNQEIESAAPHALIHAVKRI